MNDLIENDEKRKKWRRTPVLTLRLISLLIIASRHWKTFIQKFITDKYK